MTKEEIESLGFRYENKYRVYNSTDQESGVSIYRAEYSQLNPDYTEISNFGDPRFCGYINDIETLKFILSIIAK